MSRPKTNPRWTRRGVIAGGLGLGAFATPASAQTAEQIFRGVLGAAVPPSGAGLTSRDADQGLREALTLGARAAAARVGRPDGFWADQVIRIPLPRTLAQLQEGLRPLGQSGALDDLQLKLNRAAETAASSAGGIFTRAIQRMTIQDALGVLRGGETSGTDFLRQATTPELTAALRPPVTRALERVGALQALDRLAARYGATAFLGDRPRASLTEHAVSKSLDGVFYYVAQEERAIRRDPAKRTSAILRRVFGAL